MNDIFSKKEILTRDEVMDVLKIGRSTFYKLIKSTWVRWKKIEKTARICYNENNTINSKKQKERRFFLWNK